MVIVKKSFRALAGMAVLLFFLSGCQKSEEVKTGPVKPEKLLTDSRISVVHLYKDTVYTLSGLFTRQSGEQLIIDEGVLVKVKPGSIGASGNGIIINPGGIIIANGTQTAPIVFTSASPEGSQSENWGGITLQGKAINNSRGPNGDLTDFSGTLRYVRIEFASLTLDAVGSRSIIDHIMVSYSNTLGQLPPSSSFNFYGGSFDCRNLVSYACGGPADFYLTSGYSGKMQNILAYRHPFFGAKGSIPANALAGVFIENNPNDPVNARPYTYPYISNLTVVGPDTQKGSASSYGDSSLLNGALVTTGSTCFRIRNSILCGFPNAAWDLGDSLTATTIQAGNSEFSNSIVQCADSNRAFLLNPGIFRPYNSGNFKSYVLVVQPSFKDRLFAGLPDFGFTDVLNYNAPKLFLTDASPVLAGAGFDGPAFSNSFFEKVAYIGAIGKDNWLAGWTNFTPLKTNYNFPR